MKDHRIALIDLIQHHFGQTKMRAAEVGVAGGFTSVALLKAFPELFLHLVDSYDPKNFGRTKWAEHITKVEQSGKKRLAPYSGRVKWHRTESRRAAAGIPVAQLDWVFIDADHRYESVIWDIKRWSRRVKKGGMVIGHDYDSRHDRNYRTGVKPAVDYWCHMNRISIGITLGNIWYYFKYD